MSGHAFHIKHPVAEEFITALGIDHSKVRFITIKMGVDMITTVEVDYLMELENLESLNDLNKKYILKVDEIVEP